MQPIKQFQGQVPSAMNFPMEAYMAAMGNASKAMLAGSQAMGEGISQGVKAVGEAYGDYKKMESEVKSSASFAKSIADLMPDSDAKKSILDQINKATTDANLSMKQRFDMANNFKQLLGGMLGQHYKLQQIKEQEAPRIEAAKLAAEQQARTYDALSRGVPDTREEENQYNILLAPGAQRKWGSELSDIVATPEALAKAQHTLGKPEMERNQQRAKQALKNPSQPNFTLTPFGIR